MNKIIFRPNSYYYYICCFIIFLFGLAFFVGGIYFIKDRKIFAIIIGFLIFLFSIGTIIYITNLKFVFYDDYIIIPHGTYGDKLKKKERMIPYSEIKDVYYCDSNRGIPHLIIERGREKVHVNTILFSDKKGMKVEETLKSNIFNKIHIKIK